VRNVRRVDVAHAPAAEIEHLAVGERARRAVGEVVDRNHARGRAVHDLRARRHAEPFVHRAAFIGLDVTEADPAQRLDRDEPADRFRQGREHGAQAAMKQHRLFGADQKMIEGETDRRRDVGHVHRQPIDAGGDLVDSGLHGWSLLPCSKPDWGSAGCGAAQGDGVASRARMTAETSSAASPGVMPARVSAP
jgi:hypothetical protein